MSRSIKIILTCGIVILCAYIPFQFALRPLLGKLNYLTEQVKVKEAEIRLVKAKVAKISSLEANVQNAQNSEQLTSPIIPERLTLSEIYNEIDVLSKASGLKVKQISTNQTFQSFVKNRKLQYIAVSIEGNAYFPQVIGFLDSLSKSRFVIQVENLDLSSISKGSKPWLQFNITLNAFEYGAR